MTSEPLTDLERELLDFAGLTWRYAGSRDQAIRDRFKMNGNRYQQLLQALLSRPEALEYAPVTVRRLIRLRDEARAKRSRRSLPV